MDTSFKIYNASAGSGKTYTLAKEYLKIILSSSKAYRKILAITFTNKAVNEMKTRILDSLFEFSCIADFSKAPSMFKDVAFELNLDNETLRGKSDVVLKDILHNYAFFDVSTIDKFTHRLIRTFAKDLKLSQNFEVVLDRDLLLDEAVVKLISKAGNDTKLTRILIDFALEKTDDDKNWDIAFDLFRIGKLLFEENNSQHLKKLSDKEIEDFLELRKTIILRIGEAEQNAISIAEKALALILDSGLETTDFPRETLPNHFKKVLAGNFNVSRLYANKLEENLSNGKILKSGVQLPNAELPSQLLQSYLAIKDEIYLIAFLKNGYKNVVPLTVLNAIRQEIKTIETDKNQLSISEFNTIISDEIKNQPAPFIYERLGEKYRHYFIDEFQDTSEMQWNNLIPLIDNALSSETGSLFLVGDAKQAIYRWRGGKAEQFLNLINLKTNPFVINPKIERLPSNYRSHEEIIKFNNEFFTTTSPQLNSEIYRILFETGNQQNYNSKKGGYVGLTFLEANDDEKLEDQYCEEVLKTIRRVRDNRYDYNDICILVRSNREGMLLADFLTQHQIPLISSDSLLLKSNSKVRFLVDLIKLQDQPHDSQLAYDILTFLSAEKTNKHRFIAQNLKSLHPFFKSEYDFDLERLKTLSVYDGLEYGIKQFDLATTSDAYINFLMDVVLDLEQKEGIGAHQFLSYWEKKKDALNITAPLNLNAVQIMTVHKAKGLEFEIVIYPFANSNIYQELEPKLWLPVNPDSFNGFEEILVSKKQEVLNYSPTAETCYNDEQHKLELDAFNVLYVALTRAIKGLFIITKKDLAQKGVHKMEYYSGLFIRYLKEKGFWCEEVNSYAFGNLGLNDNPPSQEEQETIPYQYSFKDRPSFKILTKAGVLWDTDREDALLKGNLVHYIMGLIETESDVEKAMETSILSGDVSSEEIEKLRKKVFRIVRHPSLNLYYSKGQTVLNEQDIITETGKLLRPDRIVINENRATIIDYKTGKKDTKYKEQLYAYADALEAMGYTIENKIIIYINEEINPVFI